MMNIVCIYVKFIELLVPAFFPVAALGGLRAFPDSSPGLKIAPTPFWSRRFFALALFPKGRTIPYLSVRLGPGRAGRRGDKKIGRGLLTLRGASRMMRL